MWGEITCLTKVLTKENKANISICTVLVNLGGGGFKDRLSD